MYLYLLLKKQYNHGAIFISYDYFNSYEYAGSSEDKFRNYPTRSSLRNMRGVFERDDGIYFVADKWVLKIENT